MTDTFRKSVLTGLCPMKGICHFKRERLCKPYLLASDYTDCGEYQLLLTDMEYHHKNARERWS